MRFEEHDQFLELSRAELGPVGTPGEGDVLFDITARVSSYSGVGQAWVLASDLDGFVIELRRLEELRHGQATLSGVSPRELKLEFYSTDSVGHMAVRGYVGRQKLVRNQSWILLQLPFDIDFEPDRLPSVLKFFERIRQ